METEKKKQPAKVAAKQDGKQLLVMRIGGKISIRKDMEDTLMMMHLSRKHMCTIIPSTPTWLGMVRKVKDFIAWGEADAETIALLQEKRGEKGKDGKSKPFFRLNPPRGGYERKGTKVAFKAGGALGYRGTKINDLIKRMI